MLASMLTRWWLPLNGLVDPKLVRLPHTHAALASILDTDHEATIKPWFASPLSRAEDGSFGVEVSDLDGSAAAILTEAATTSATLSLGPRARPQVVQPGHPQLIAAAEWRELSKDTSARRWQVDFQTPTCFRRRNKVVSPLPSVEPILRTLDTYWTTFSGLDSRLTGHDSLGVEVIDCNIRTHWVQIASPKANGGRLPSKVPGFTGQLTFEAPAEAAATVGPLFSLIDFVSIGSFARRGLGVARLVSTHA